MRGEPVRPVWLLSFILSLLFSPIFVGAATTISSSWVNSTALNATGMVYASSLCIAGDCRTLWPINTTAQVFAAVDNLTYHKYSITMSLSNITDPADCAAGQFVYGKSGFSWVCRADLFNTTVQIQAAQTINTTNEVFAAVNNNTFQTGTELFNTSAQVLTLIVTNRNMTGAGTAGYVPLWYNTSALNTSSIFQKNSYIGIGTTFPNSTLDVVGNLNAAGNISATGVNVTSNITAGSALVVGSGTSWLDIYSEFGYTFFNSTQAFIFNRNLILESGRSAGIGTYAPVQTLDVVGTINATSQYCLGTNAAASCISSWPFNTSAQVNAALNTTFTGQLGKNTTAEIQAAQKITGNTSAEILAIAVSRSDWTSIDNYPTTCGANQRVVAIGDTLTCANDLFNTTAEIQAAQKTTGNTTNEIFAAVDNSTFHRFNQQITWANLSSWSLNNVWTGTVGWGNVSLRSLDIVWTNGGLGAGNITTGTLANSRLDTNVHFINSTTQLLTAGNLTTGTINATHLVTNLGLNIGNLTVPQDFSMNLKNITAVNNVTFGTANAWVYWNGTCLITKGTTSRVEVC